MVQEQTLTNTISVKDTIIRALQDKKAREIVSLDLRDFDSSTVDLFIICHGTSHRHVEALAVSVEEQAEKEKGEVPWHREGLENKEWVLMDYVDVVVHIFLEEKRKFYGLEELWSDAEKKEYSGRDKQSEEKNYG